MPLTAYPTLRLKLTPAPALKLRFLPAIPGGNVSGKVERSGDTMEGSLILAHDPVTDMEAVTKQYVDNSSVLDEVLVTLSDAAATVPLNAALGNVFHLTAASADRTILVPTNAPANGWTQKMVIRFKASGGARTLSLTPGAGGFRFGTTIAALTQTTSGLTDYVGCIWNYGEDRWDVVSYSKGF